VGGTRLIAFDRFEYQARAAGQGFEKASGFVRKTLTTNDFARES
jgi:hypothetical protein